jgi:hypothetical protein
MDPNFSKRIHPEAKELFAEGAVETLVFRAAEPAAALDAPLPVAEGRVRQKRAHD